MAEVEDEMRRLKKAMVRTATIVKLTCCCLNCCAMSSVNADKLYASSSWD